MQEEPNIPTVIDKPEILPEMKISVGNVNGEVVIMFTKPTTGFTMSKKNAREFATKINKAALK